MDTTYDVRIWKLETRQGRTGTTYRVIWRVGQSRFQPTFKRRAQADNFRGSLLSAAGRGEAFRVTDGLPVSMARQQDDKSFFVFACEYMDFKWRDSSPGHRRNAAEALTTVAIAMANDARGRPGAAELRRTALVELNPTTRSAPDSATRAALWLRENTKPVAQFADPKLVHSIISALGAKMDGDRCAVSTARRKRMTLTNALDYAVSCGLLTANPMPALKSALPSNGKAMRQVDKRSVVNPVQARSLLNEVRDLGERGRRLKAFFGTMYFAGLRPEEAVVLSRQNMMLPVSGWGTLYLADASPDISPQWTDSHDRSEKRALKHRAIGETRPVPCPPELVTMLREHLENFGTAPDGRLFRGARSDQRVSSSVYGRVWREARQTAFTAEVQASPLAARPYDLRHACVSTWLAAGVQPARVAEWAGHSVAVLMQVYAKCLDGGEQAAHGQIEALLGTPSGRGNE